MNIRNFTPHPINIIRPDDCYFDSNIRKYVASPDVTPMVSLPSEGVLNARIFTESGDSINGIPTFNKKVEGCDPLPNDDDIFIVSALYASAARKSGINMDRIMLVADPVMSPDGRTFIGCRGLAAPF